MGSFKRCFIHTFDLLVFLAIVFTFLLIGFFVNVMLDSSKVIVVNFCSITIFIIRMMPRIGHNWAINKKKHFFKLFIESSFNVHLFQSVYSSEKPNNPFSSSYDPSWWCSLSDSVFPRKVFRMYSPNCASGMMSPFVSARGVAAQESMITCLTVLMTNWTLTENR